MNCFVVEIGAQQMSNNFLRSEDLVRKAEALFGATRPFAMPAPGRSISSAEHNELLSSDAPFARDFWVALGFEYTAIDVDGSPGSIPLDLNYDQVPGTLQNRYGLVTNLGTTEHICNQLNAFKAIHDLAAPGGVMIHHLPAGGMLNHGLVNYNPKFFWHLARSNEYRWLYMSFFGGAHHYPIPKNLLDCIESYDPASSRAMRHREISDYSIHVAFQKILHIPFVAPLDVDAGTRTSNAAINRRYWTVFQPDILESVRRDGSVPEWILQSPTDESENAHKDSLPVAIRRADSQSEERIHRALVHIPSRRYVALIAVVSALSTVMIMALILIGARSLFF